MFSPKKSCSPFWTHSVLFVIRWFSILKTEFFGRLPSHSCVHNTSLFKGIALGRPLNSATKYFKANWLPRKTQSLQKISRRVNLPIMAVGSKMCEQGKYWASLSCCWVSTSSLRHYHTPSPLAQTFAWYKALIQRQKSRKPTRTGWAVWVLTRAGSWWTSFLA